MFAIKLKRPYLCKLIINSGADLEIRDSNGKTAIFYSIEYNSVYIFNLLLKRGASVKVRDDKFQNPFLFSIGYNNNMYYFDKLIGYN